jgi:hypothetical protein
MLPMEFIEKWKPVTLTEMSAYQQHFLDLCELLNEKKPAEVDPTGNSFTFQKGLTTNLDTKGFADVWKRGCFGWEYKGKHKDLSAAYQQLLRYREALENPPILVVCDMDKFVIRTNFTGTQTQIHQFELDDLGDPQCRQLLKAVFADPYSLKPGVTQEEVTEEIAGKFAALADGMRGRGVSPDEAAHFLMKLMFCMFAEDIDLLPQRLFEKTVRSARSDPKRLSKLLTNLFESMATGEPFGPEDILHFNGGLFNDTAVIDLDKKEIGVLLDCAEKYWAQVEPSIFGTLFERILDPNKRSQLGAHYTSRADIETLLKPVMLDPLRREWDAVRTEADALYAKLQATVRGTGKGTSKQARTKFDKCVLGFLDRLLHVTVLDPACGSGNFLYVALRMLLDLEKEVWVYATTHGITHIPHVNPSQLRGIELNPHAQQLAQVVIWIGYLQWMKDSGIRGPDVPVLDTMENIECRDAILDLTDPEHPKEPNWPDAEFIVGNPPFLGGNRIRSEFGDQYVNALFTLYEGRVPAFADLCCYWFEKTRAMIETGRTKRAGLLATQSIRGGANREVLVRIKGTGDIFFAISDKDWILDGAALHISMVGFDNGSEQARSADGQTVSAIHPNLAAGSDITLARRLAENGPAHIEGVKKGAKFELDSESAVRFLGDANPHRKPNSDVVRAYVNGTELIDEREAGWIVCYPPTMSENEAQHYAAPYAYIKEKVFPKYGTKRAKWWVHERPRPQFLLSLAPLSRYLCVVKHAKHRIFIWVPSSLLVSNALEAFLREDDYFFGVLHSRLHVLWSLRMGTQLEDRPRYTPTTCFETFPFPEPTDAQREAISAAAKELDTLRTNWLNPPEWTRTEVLEFPGSANGPWKRYVTDVDLKRGIGTVRYPRMVAKDAASAEKLKKRTLTNLYNESPAWLKTAHAKLDVAVFAAYGWPTDISDDDLLARLLALNLSRAAATGPARDETDNAE